jgi:tetratricopeptide (TPR) repeat protein
VDRIATEFAGDPETQLQLLGVASEIYGYWADEPRFVALLEKRKEIARRHFGMTHPAFIESLTIDAWSSIYSQDYVAAQRLLDQADSLIRDGDHDDSLLRAQWWLAKAEALKAGNPDQRIAALDSAVELFARLAPGGAEYAIALANSAIAHFVREDFAGAVERNQRAIAVFRQSKDRSDGDLAATYANLARSLQQSGDFDAAERAYQEFASLHRSLHSQDSAGGYWLGSADHARMVHMRGDRKRALRMFADLFALIPEDWKINTEDVIAREYFAERLAAEGRAREAIPYLEAAERSYTERPMREYDLRRARQTLGDAYDRAGRSEDARRLLEAARAERMRKDAAESIAVLGARERWARFLLDHGDAPGASSELAEVLRIGADRAIAPMALAHADLARLAIQRGDLPRALEQSRFAIVTLEKVKGLYDVRIGPSIWRVHAHALALSGDATGAATWNLKAIEASRLYDGP